jgi:hypothetical protein
MKNKMNTRINGTDDDTTLGMPNSLDSDMMDENEKDNLLIERVSDDDTEEAEGTVEDEEKGTEDEEEEDVAGEEDDMEDEKDGEEDDDTEDEEEDTDIEDEKDGVEEDDTEDEEEEEQRKTSSNTKVKAGKNSTIIIGTTIGKDPDAIKEETKLYCENCGSAVDANRYGKIVCESCGTIQYRQPPFLLRKYPTIETELQSKYTNLLFSIRNKISDRNFKQAFQLALQAEELGPGESATWENFALALYHKERFVDTKPTNDITKNILLQLNKCKFYKIDDRSYEELSGFFANELFLREKTRLNNQKPQKDKNGNEVWRYDSLFFCFQCLRCIEKCYFNLNNNIRFIEECVMELSKPYKWLLREFDGKIKKIATCRKLPIVERRNAWIREILKVKPDYIPPEIAMEPFEVIGVEDYDPNNITIISIKKIK